MRAHNQHDLVAWGLVLLRDRLGVPLRADDPYHVAVAALACLELEAGRGFELFDLVRGVQDAADRTQALLVVHGSARHQALETCIATIGEVQAMLLSGAPRPEAIRERARDGLSKAIAEARRLICGSSGKPLREAGPPKLGLIRDPAGGWFGRTAFTPIRGRDVRLPLTEGTDHV